MYIFILIFFISQLLIGQALAITIHTLPCEFPYKIYKKLRSSGILFIVIFTVISLLMAYKISQFNSYKIIALIGFILALSGYSFGYYSEQRLQKQKVPYTLNEESFPQMTSVKNHIIVVTKSEKEFIHIRNLLRHQSPQSFNIYIRHFTNAPTKDDISVVAHLAIIFTHSGINHIPDNYYDDLKEVFDLVYCSVYCMNSVGVDLDTDKKEILDSLAQRTKPNSPEFIVESAIQFLHRGRKPEFLLFGLRDNFSIKYYESLKLFWPLSYFFTLFHSLNLAFPDLFWVIKNILYLKEFIYVSGFFTSFFLVHALYVSTRNLLFEIKRLRTYHFIFDIYYIVFVFIPHSLPLIGSLSISSLLISIGSYATYSIFRMSESWSIIVFSFAISSFVYSSYLSARCIRIECRSLFEIQEVMQNNEKRINLATKIGNIGLHSSSFPFLNPSSKSIFISYMMSSDWSQNIASQLNREFRAIGWKVFFDKNQTSISSGSSWRQRLQRGVSECSYFVALIDSDTKDLINSDTKEGYWVLAESTYAALLRKELGKPIILLVLKNTIEDLQGTTFKLIYKDLLDKPQSSTGARILESQEDSVSAKVIQDQFDKIEPIKLL